jgi:hypothetical protein
LKISVTPDSSNHSPFPSSAKLASLLPFIRALTFAWRQENQGNYKHNNMRGLKMSAQSKLAAGSCAYGNVTFLDAMVIGAGVAGLYQLYRLREMGLTVRAYDTRPALAEHGIGTVTLGLVLTLKLKFISTGSRKNSINRGSQPSAFPPSPKPRSG